MTGEKNLKELREVSTIKPASYFDAPKKESMGDLFHEIPFLFPGNLAILALCVILVYDMTNGGNIWAGTAGIILAVLSIGVIDVGILKLRKLFHDEENSLNK